jgi:hypothetical protein
MKNTDSQIALLNFEARDVPDLAAMELINAVNELTRASNTVAKEPTTKNMKSYVAAIAYMEPFLERMCMNVCAEIQRFTEGLEKGLGLVPVVHTRLEALRTELAAKIEVHTKFREMKRNYESALLARGLS